MTASRFGHADGLPRYAIAALCVVVQICVIFLVYVVHENYIAPKIGIADTPRSQPGILPVSNPSHLAMIAPTVCPLGCIPSANCSTVTLANADKEVLSREIDSIMKALADENPWDLGAWEHLLEEDGGITTEDILKLEKGMHDVARYSDQKYGRQSDENIPGVEDLHAELQAYSDSMIAQGVEDVNVAAARQHKTTAGDSDLLPWDFLNETRSIESRVEFINGLHWEIFDRESVKVAITATTGVDVQGVRSEILPWIQWHLDLGATRFYLLYDGHDEDAVDVLTSINCVELIHIHDPWASEKDQALLKTYTVGAAQNRETAQWTGRPGNYELMIKQGYGEHEALKRAKIAEYDWLMHIDPDELFLPGGPVLSLTAVLARVPKTIPAIRFMNFEGQPEIVDSVNRYEQVTLFRVHKHFITPEALFYRGKYKLGDNAAFLMLYANGKSAVRVNAPGVRHMGPHFFSGNASPLWQSPENPQGRFVNLVSDDSVILHYAYSYLSDVSNKAHRSCPEGFLEAAKRGDRSKVKECFVIEFDADAYMAAAQGQDEDFFISRLVLSEGSRLKCTIRDSSNRSKSGWCTLTDVERFKFLMEKVGLYRRVLAPQTVLRAHERTIQQLIRKSAELENELQELWKHRKL